MDTEPTLQPGVLVLLYSTPYLDYENRLWGGPTEHPYRECAGEWSGRKTCPRWCI